MHEVSGGIVGNDLVGDFLLGQFPSREGGTLGAGPGFVAVDVEFPAGGLGGIEGSGGGADVNEGEPAGVAVGEDPHVVADEIGPMPADAGAMAGVLVGELLCCGQCDGLLFGDGFTGVHGGADFDECVDRVDSRGAGGGKGVLD